jgi:alginate O-acetyltransferase complex protein AlgI
MLFNSLEFAIFLPTVFLFYWFATNKSLRCQNILLLVSSYIFYGWWDWRFLSLIIFSSFVDYCVGRGLQDQDNKTKRKLLLLTSIVVNCSFLGFFKYYNFFAESFVDAFSLLGCRLSVKRLEIILPVGISFYTFQTLSYSIDVYKRKIEPTRDMIAFFSFVAFFPQLVSGPIERATNLLPQFCRQRKFEYDQAVDGMRQILWGLFKKVVIADTCARYADEIFAGYIQFSGSILFLGAMFFAFQIYGDFSGYTDIAIGTSRLFGFNLKNNFAFPYLSRDIAEFWRRWHISLSTWFRDYLYIPLGGSRGGAWNKIRNVFIIFLVSGFWHGAKWTFIIWGFIHACYFLPLLLFEKNRINTDIVAQGKLIPSVKETLQIGSTFFLSVIAWVFFRAESVETAVTIVGKMFSFSFFQHSFNELLLISGGWIFLLHIFYLVIFNATEWFQREKPHGLSLSPENGLNIFIRRAVYFILAFCVLFSANYHAPKAFIYFQF